MSTMVSKQERNEEEHFDVMALKYDENYSYNDPFTQYKIAKKTNELVNIVNSLFDGRRLKALELGCGTGEYTLKVAKKLPNVKITGIDISGKILAVARKKCSKLSNVSFRKKSAYNTGYKSKSFDLVIGYYILHHLSIEKVTKEIERVLKPGGLVFFYEPNILNPLVYLIKSNKFLKKMAGDSPDEWGMNPFSIKKYFEGYEVISIRTSEFTLPLPFIPLKLKILVDRVLDTFSKIPILKYFGGSVVICLKKNS